MLVIAAAQTNHHRTAIGTDFQSRVRHNEQLYWLALSNMNIPAPITARHEALTHLRRDLHRHPELAFREHRTAALVAARLVDAGFDVCTGIGGTGVVGTLSRGTGKKSIGLRADMDALPMEELNSFEHRSVNKGAFHGCGHDGHTAMLLGAAEYLAAHGHFNGTVHLIFQPAEEGEGGADAMIRDGLFDRFPVDAVYALHNLPGLPVGCFSIAPGPLMAAFAAFDIEICGKGGHGAMPHLCVDPIVIGAQLIQSLQSVVSRNLNPQDAGVVSITHFHAGNALAYNVIPHTARISGGVRYLDSGNGELIETRMRGICSGLAIAYDVEIAFEFNERYPVLVNSADETGIAARCAAAVAGDNRVDTAQQPVMGSEDFAFMLQVKPGAYAFIGNGDRDGGCMVHHPNYDFNDDILPLGAAYFVNLVEDQLR